MNGAVEAANKNIKRILGKMTDTYKDWHEKLPFALLAYRTSIRTSTGATSFSLVYGMEAVLPIEVEIPSLRVLMEIKLDEVEWVQDHFEQLNLIEEKRLSALSYGQMYQKESCENMTKGYDPDAFMRTNWFSSSIWGDHFLSYASNIMEEDHDKKEEHQKLKNELQKMLMTDQVDKPLEMLKLIDAIQGLGFEQKRGHVASAIECYMKQHDATELEAVKEFREQITKAWKDINEECLHPTIVSISLLTRILNLSRVIDVVYKTKDGYTHTGVILKDFVPSLLINHAPPL
ncbi:(-)-germacrene D synthase-like [Durio zibethinus]|uniref:(-)-germacrene D synthase-like n=1 Tax=Durio zibethinus TaxID=66656 RepID=A0A6P5Z5W4_DURZI|nr:(-)-germacrene D synthase-like [Durio zibethinus]